MVEVDNRPQIVCFASSKGGSGKTVVAASVAAILAELGHRVLLVDSDGATNGMTLFYLSQVVRSQSKTWQRRTTGLFEANESNGWVTTTIPVREGVDFLPAAYDPTPRSAISLSDVENVLSSLAVEAGEHDFIVIDAQAGDDPIAVAAMRASDQIVVVSEFDPVSSAGVERLKALIADELAFDRTWVLLNKLLPEFAKSYDEFMLVGKYLSPLPWDADVVRAMVRRDLPVNLEAGNAFTVALLRSLKQLLGDEIASDVDQWQLDKQAGIRDDAAKQLADAEDELFHLRDMRRDIEGRMYRVRSRWLEALTVALSLIGFGAITAGVVVSELVGMQTWSIAAAAGSGLVTAPLAVLLFRNAGERRKDRELELKEEAAAVSRRIELAARKVETLRTVVDGGESSRGQLGPQTAESGRAKAQRFERRALRAIAEQRIFDRLETDVQFEDEVGRIKTSVRFDAIGEAKGTTYIIEAKAVAPTNPRDLKRAEESLRGHMDVLRRSNRSGDRPLRGILVISDGPLLADPSDSEIRFVRYNADANEFSWPPGLLE